MEKMKLSSQFIAAIMMALQRSLMELTDIVPEFKQWEIVNSTDGLVVLNPPMVEILNDTIKEVSEDVE